MEAGKLWRAEWRTLFQMLGSNGRSFDAGIHAERIYRSAVLAAEFGMSAPLDTDPTQGEPPLAGPAKGRFEVRLTSDSHFAWLRTRLSLERTLMSWVRTAVSLIGFGFAIVQFFERIQQIPGSHPGAFPEAPRFLGLSLIFCGVLALVISLWQYWWSLRYLWSGSFIPIAGITKEGMQSPVVAVSVLLTLIGVFAFVAVLLRVA